MGFVRGGELKGSPGLVEGTGEGSWNLKVGDAKNISGEAIKTLSGRGSQIGQ